MSLVCKIEDLRAALYDAIKDKSPDFVIAESRKSGTRLNLISRAMRRYYAAKDASKKFGLIGVGCFSFAQDRLEKFCRKVGLHVEEPRT